MFRATDIADNASQRVLDELEAIKFRRWEIEIERVAVIKFGLYQGGGNQGSCCLVKIWTNATEVTDVKEARLGQGRDLVMV